MVIAHDAGVLAVAGLIAATSQRKRRCRETLRFAVERLERPQARNARVADGAAQCIRTACAACSKCPGI